MSAGKGSKQRPTDRAKYDANYSAINWKRVQKSGVSIDDKRAKCLNCKHWHGGSPTFSECDDKCGKKGW